MTNHVENFIVIENVDNAVKKEIESIFQTENEVVDTEILLKRIFKNINMNDVDEDWMIENCGSPSFNGYIESISNQRVVVIINSDLHPVNGLIMVLFEKLYLIKSDIVVHNTFEDEFYNFAGVYYVSDEYENTKWLDIDNWNIPRISEDEEYRNYFHETLDNQLVSHKNIHREVIEEYKNESFDESDQENLETV